MIRFFYILFLFFISLDARDNPFFPIDGEEQVPFTSNEDRTKEALSRATIAIPSQARLIKKVTVEFKNLDGSLESKTIELDNSIDWHLPLFISQSYTQKTTNNTQKQIPIVEKEIKKDIEFKKLSGFKHASFYSNNKTFKIVTKDKITRNFLLGSPHRIVVDFDKDIRFTHLSQENKNNIFTKVRVANHKGYYRVVIELDGFYKYTMQKVSDGYLFKLI